MDIAGHRVRLARSIVFIVFGALLLPGVIGGGRSPANAAPSITYTYSVRGLGNTSSLEDFASRAAQTYEDGRGWNLGGSISFVRVADGGHFTLWLSAPGYLPTFSSGCSTQYSCRVGRNVIINEARFLGATSVWNATGWSLRDYQHMVVNHETGHWLGFGHATCRPAGQPAPVMQQQSKGLGGCWPNPWPTASERASLSRSKGVPIVTPPPPRPPGPPLAQAQSLVAQVYRDVLGREPDEGGLQGWSQVVHTGAVNRPELLTAMVYSRENATRTAAAMYREILGREPDPGGLAGWSAALEHRAVTVKDARAAFWSSPERQGQAASAQAWVAELYTRELGRAADPGGLAGWTQVVGSQGAASAAAGVIRSDEWARRQVAAGYAQLLKREPDPAGVQGWSRVLLAGDVPSVQIGLGASDEYFARATAG